MLNLGMINEAIATAVPDRECLVFRDRRFTWWEVADRTRRLADVLRRFGLGCHTERAELENWESGQDHVALYMYNGNEYLEGMLGAYKARTAPFNVNYRYVDEELSYLLDDADARAVIFHASFAPVVERIRDELPKVALWLQVADESKQPLLPGALDYERALAEASPAPPPGDLSPDDLYILYTGGTTGRPKGVLWRQEDIFRAGLYQGAVESLEDIVLEDVVEKAKRRAIRALAAPPFMHGAAHWAAFNMLHVGGTVIVQSNPRRLDPHDIWSTVEAEKVEAVNIVGDAFGRPLVDQLRKRSYALSSLRLLTTSGAILSAGLKREFLELLPGLRILDALGSSESGAQASQFSTRGSEPTTGDFAMRPDSVVFNEDLSGVVAAGSGEQGWLARRGIVPLGYYRDAEKTAKTFPVIGGVRYAVSGDRVVVAADGVLHLLGRDSVTINTGGEKVFAEEVEHALKRHPSVYDVVVVGTPHERWGQRVTAVVHLRDGEHPSDRELCDVVREHIAPFKLPRAFVFVDRIVRFPSGKADYHWARATALGKLGLG